MMKKGALVLIAISLFWLVTIVSFRLLVITDVYEFKNTRWRLVSYTLSNVKTELQYDPEKELYLGIITIEFSNEGQVSGSDGCNSYYGSYEVNDGSIEINIFRRTAVLCLHDGVRQREQEYMVALRTTGRYKIDYRTLTIWYSDGQLNFEQMIPLAAPH